MEGGKCFAQYLAVDTQALKIIPAYSNQQAKDERQKQNLN